MRTLRSQQVDQPEHQAPHDQALGPDPQPRLTDQHLDRCHLQLPMMRQTFRHAHHPLSIKRHAPHLHHRLYQTRSELSTGLVSHCPPQTHFKLVRTWLNQ